MATALTIRPYDTASDAAAVSALWQETLAQYPVLPHHLEQLLALPWGAHFVALLPSTTGASDRLVGFCATYTDVLSVAAAAAAAATGSMAYLPVILIHPDYQGSGYGTELLQHSLNHLWTSIDKVTVGCPIPRFWPGIPTDIRPQDQAFFEKRGFVKQEQIVKDFYQPLSTFQPPQYILNRASSAGISFAPLTAAGYDECIAGMEAKFPQWAGGYRSLHSEGLHDNIMVAFDSNNKQVGWSLMLMPGQSRLWHGFAFLPIAGGGENGKIRGSGKTALIAAVGVSEDARGKGVGLGLIVAVMEELKRRGDESVDGVFIDSVVLENFYEKVGFGVWAEYRGAVVART